MMNLPATRLFKQERQRSGQRTGQRRFASMVRCAPACPRAVQLSGMGLPLRLLILLILLLTLLLPARAQVGQLPAMSAGQVSVSGLSSGAYMAVQFEVAFSATVTGAGIIAGGPYFCAQGSVYTATTRCSCTSELFACRVHPGGTRIADLIVLTDWFAADLAIDATSNLATHKVWLLSGSIDSVVPQPVMTDLFNYYRHYMPASQIVYRRTLPAEHGLPTDQYGNPCTHLGSPYINNCSYDAAGQLLQWIYGPLLARNSGPPAGRTLAFVQSEFLPFPTLHGMAAVGYLYLPPACEASAGAGCRLHVVFHGCLQDPNHIGSTFINHAGYNGWADTNRLMILYPQASATATNPQACWDWFAYDDPRYALKSGHQMAAIKRMVDRLTGVNPAILPAAPRCRPDRCT